MKMTDATVEVTETRSEPLRIPVVKAKGEFLDLDVDNLPIHVYRELLIQGGKVVLNRGQTKITKAAYPNPDELRAAALEKAQETLQAMYAGKIRIVGGSKSDKVSREVMTLARNKARAVAKKQIKDQGLRLGLFSGKDITAAANAMIAADPSYIAEAQAEWETAQNREVKGFDFSTLKPDKEKAAALERKKLEKTLSAAKAGQVAARGRPPGRPATH
jgi:hypothetical protein